MSEVESNNDINKTWYDELGEAGFTEDPEATKQLDKELRKLEKKYDKPLHHYQDQPSVRKMKMVARRRRKERLDRFWDVLTTVLAITAIIIFGGLLIVMLIIKEGLGL